MVDNSLSVSNRRGFETCAAFQGAALAAGAVALLGLRRD